MAMCHKRLCHKKLKIEILFDYNDGLGWPGMASKSPSSFRQPHNNSSHWRVPDRLSLLLCTAYKKRQDIWVKIWKAKMLSILKCWCEREEGKILKVNEQKNYGVCVPVYIPYCVRVYVYTKQMKDRSKKKEEKNYVKYRYEWRHIHPRRPDETLILLSDIYHSSHSLYSLTLPSMFIECKYGYFPFCPLFILLLTFGKENAPPISLFLSSPPPLLHFCASLTLCICRRRQVKWREEIFKRNEFSILGYIMCKLNRIGWSWHTATYKIKLNWKDCLSFAWICIRITATHAFHKRNINFVYFIQENVITNILNNT